MRRLYRRRADTMVFATIAAISIGVLAVYFEMKDQEAPATSDAEGPDTPRLVILPTTARSDLVLEPDILEGMPQLEIALLDVDRMGGATIREPATIDAIWYLLADAYGISTHRPIVVEREGARYSLQMID